MKRAFYFLADRLQITSAERYSILVVGALFLLISGIQQFSSTSAAYADETYSAVFAEFHQLSALPAAQKQEILKQYYPEENPLVQTIAVTGPEKKVEAAETITAPASVNDASAYTDTVETAEVISEKVNINTADASRLATLPGVGPAIAARIIEYRSENGPFKQIEDIKQVRGIGDARFEAIKDLITVAD